MVPAFLIVMVQSSHAPNDIYAIILQQPLKKWKSTVFQEKMEDLTCSQSLQDTWRRVQPAHVRSWLRGDLLVFSAPGEHYIEIKKDFSNLEDVINMIKSDQLRKKIVERCYLDIVLSGTYSYKKFVSEILRVAFSVQPILENNDRCAFFHSLAELMDRFSWIKVRMFCIMKNFIKKIIRR